MKDILSKILEKANLKKKVLEPQLYMVRADSHKKSYWNVRAFIAYTEDEAKDKARDFYKRDRPKDECEVIDCMEGLSLKEVLEMFDEYSEEGQLAKKLME